MTLEFDGIQFGYGGKSLLSGIHVKCELGKITGLLGRNGTGKSTLLKIAFGAIRPDLVSIRVDGRAVEGPPFAKSVVSYLPQDTFLPANLTLGKMLRLYGVADNKILECFPEFEADMKLYPPQVSGGRLRLFEVLVILLRDAPFCLLDEPFTGLSPLFIERLQKVLIEVKKNKGIVISDHLYRQVMSIADNVYLLTNGSTYLIKDDEDLARRGYV